MTDKPDFKVKYAGVTDLREIVSVMLDLQDQHAGFKAEAAAVWAELEFLKKIHGPELMGEQTLIKWEGFSHKLQQQSDIYASATAGITEDMKDWLFDNDGEALVKDTVNSSALKAFLRKRLLAGQPIPAEHFKVEPFSFIKVVRS